MFNTSYNNCRKSVKKIILNTKIIHLGLCNVFKKFKTFYFTEHKTSSRSLKKGKKAKVINISF